MSVQCEEQLRNAYRKTSDYLAGTRFELEDAQYSDYLVRCTLLKDGKPVGKLLMDYSPKKGKHAFRKGGGLPESLFAEFQQYCAPAAVSPATRISDTIPVHAWVDGSYLYGRVGYGAVILKEGSIMAELFGEVVDPIAIQSRQVGGELRAVMEAIRWCRQNGVSEVAVFFDFLNLEKWAIGAYKTNNDMTRAYKAYMDKSPVRVVWNKVPSHTGIAWNDYADRLAKRGASGETGGIE